MYFKWNKLRHIFLIWILLISTLLSSFSVNHTVYADNTTFKVDLNVVNLYSDNTVDEKREFWVRETVPAAVDISVSGSGTELSEPWVVLTVPKTKVGDLTKISKPIFVDSAEAYETEKTEDENNYYVIYKFHRIGGGFRGTYPFPFAVNEEAVRDRDELNINLKIVDGKSTADSKPVLYNKDITYVLRKQEYMTNVAIAEWYHGNSYPRAIDDTFDNSSTKLKSDTLLYNVNLTEGETATGTTPLNLETKVGINLKVQEGITSKLSLKPVEYVKEVYTLPETIEPRMSNNAVTNGTIATWKIQAGVDAEYDSSTRKLTIIRYKPSTIYDNWHWYTNPHIVGNWNSGQAYFKATNSPLNTILNVTVDITQKYEDEPAQTFQKLTLPIEFRPVYFKQTGSMDVWKDNLNGSANVDGRAINYSEGTYYFTRPKGELYSQRTNLESLRMVQQGIVRNTNNGSSFSDKTGGIVTHVYKLTDTLNRDRKGLYYKKFKFYNSNEAINTQLDTKENVLYGIKADGTKVELARNIKSTDTVTIEDTTSQYTNLEIEFLEPIQVDNTDFKYIIEVDLTDDEWQKFSDGEYVNRQNYYGTTSVDYINSAIVANVSEAKRQDEVYKGRYSYISVWKPQPVISLTNVSPTVRVLPYTAEGTSFTFKQQYRINENTFGPIDKVKNLKVISMLPPGFKYKSKGYFWGGYNVSYGEPQVIENYKGTGQTALIWSFGDLNITGGNGYFEINPVITTDKNTPSGQHRLYTYMTYDDNDIVSPDNNNIRYIDQLDLDDDNDYSESYIYGSTTVTFIPPLELLVSKVIGLDTKPNSMLVTGDLGGNVYYGLRLFNNTIAEVRTISTIDTLPALGDHMIASNQSGEYTPRGSQFSTPLTKALEDVTENQTLLEKFDIFYQLTLQGIDLASVRDGEWLTKDQVSDFSQVKSIK
ncbi:hypothetical protein HZY83_01905 [Gemella sp. GH3]|uniref:hypothetical protein n=1 Tax=unclassified Gemella TaxID=2624949 RepID=UPI0015D0722B|nr:MULTISPECIES: hypothetical protein [unclassified Gemella]MBF0713442.1 hypothetical protein [Gemella sp. GH3.1]NYS50394.1 hypothetical protein [Gemella sp. GH3]